MQTKFLARLLLLTAVWMFTAGASTCSSDGVGPTFVADLVLKDSAGTIRQQFARGEPITLELSVRNRTDSETVLQLSSTQVVDFVVLDAGTSRVRWRWSHGLAFPQVITEIVFAPGETKTFGAIWNQPDNDGQAVGPGNYEARGAVMFPAFSLDPLSEHQLASQLELFTIT